MGDFEWPVEVKMSKGISHSLLVGEIRLDWKKIDPLLHSVLNSLKNQTDQKFTVFVHTINPPLNNSIEAHCLEEMGVQGINGRRTVFSANLLKKNIDHLSNLSWVKFIVLSQTLRPLD